MTLLQFEPISLKIGLKKDLQKNFKQFSGFNLIHLNGKLHLKFKLQNKEFQCF